VKNNNLVNNIRVSSCCSWFIFFLILFNSSLFAQTNTEASRLATIQYGTETEIAALIQTLRAENVTDLDDELVTLIQNTRNYRILIGVFAFFGDREKSGLEERAVKAIQEREDEANETVQSAIEYLGRLKYAQAVPVLIELLDTEERRFMNNAFRALGRAGSSDADAAAQAADFLIDFYENRNPGTDNEREIVTAVGATGSSNGVSFLVGIASNTDERIALRIAAIEALSRIGDPSSLDTVLECVSTNDPNVRSAAVAALGPFSGEAVDSAILDAFRDSYYRTRIAAAQASRDRKLAAAVPYLQYRAERDDVPNVKDEAIRALGAIANDEAMTVLQNLFTERKNADRVRMLAAEMIMKNAPDGNFTRVVVEMEEAKARNQTVLYNGLLKVVGEAVFTGNTSEIENIARTFLRTGGIMEKLYGLDMAANNNLRSLSEEIINMARDRNESIARKARRIADSLGIEIPETPSS
jgi:HEAT repeat protein